MPCEQKSKKTLLNFKYFETVGTFQQHFLILLDRFLEYYSRVKKNCKYYYLYGQFT